MKYKKLDDLELSTLGMGNMRLPVIDGKDNNIDYDKAKEMIDYCMEKGINYYDTAYIYHGGESENFLAKALKKYPRDSYYLADKFNMMANPDYNAQFDEQLNRLQTEYIDFYMLHGIMDGFIDNILNCGCVEYFDNLKKQGKIKYLGFSYHGSVENLQKVIDTYDWDFIQLQINYYDWYFGDAKALYDVATKANISIMVMEPVHGGLLANLTEKAGEILKEYAPNKSLVSWAMRFVMSLDNVYVVLSGMSNMNHVEDNIETFNEGKRLSEKEQQLVKEAATVQNNAVAVPCTACRYCCLDCPKDLDIPYLLKVYNETKVGGEWRVMRLIGLSKDKDPAECINCGLCVKHCPQNLKIPEYMQEMTGLLKKFMS